MKESGSALGRRQSRAARRLNRLFQIERNGGFERWPAATVSKLIERRGSVVEALLTMELKRRSTTTQPSPELDSALFILRGEIDRALDRAQTRLEQISKELRLSRGEGLPTGIRNSAHGHPLGTT